MTKRKQPITSILAHNSIKKVTAEIIEIHVEPDYMYKAVCPYCEQIIREEVYEDNCTFKINCHNCLKDFKVKIPKFY